MNVKHLNDEALLKRTGDLIRQENEAFALSLHCLLEIERRRLYAKENYPSLFAMLMKKYGQSESHANRRIDAMKLIQAVPEVEEKLKSGSLSLTNAVLAQTHFRREAKFTNKPLTKTEKLELIETLEMKSAREAERIVLSVSSAPALIKADKARPVTPELTEFRFMAKNQLQEKMDRVRGLIAHKNPNPTMEELLDLAFDIALKQLDPGQKQVRAKKVKQEQHAKPPAPEVAAEGGTPSIETQMNRSTAIPAATRREVWRRDESKCRRCGSRYALEPDHIVPRAKGGTNELSNLRLLCRSCNQRAAIEHFGVRKMHQYRLSLN